MDLKVLTDLLLSGKNWKDKVAELGFLGGFRKNKINDPANPDYLTTFLMESNKRCITLITKE